MWYLLQYLVPGSVGLCSVAVGTYHSSTVCQCVLVAALTCTVVSTTHTNRSNRHDAQWCCTWYHSTTGQTTQLYISPGTKVSSVPDAPPLYIIYKNNFLGMALLSVLIAYQVLVLIPGTSRYMVYNNTYCSWGADTLWTLPAQLSCLLHTWLIVVFVVVSPAACAFLLADATFISPVWSHRLIVVDVVVVVVSCYPSADGTT